MEIKRVKELKILKDRFKDFPALAILGPRQCGKTTLARQFAGQYNSSKIHFFDLEDQRDLAKLENPFLVLENLTGIVILDEIQRRPELFPVLRVLIDRQPSTRYLILGRASRDLISQGSESLAGRLSFVELGGFSLDELSDSDSQKLWSRGGFPRSFLAGSHNASYQWRQDFITTFLERDIPNLGIRIPAKMIRRFWLMLAHYHGQIFSASELGRSLSTTDTTVKRYLDLLTGTFIVRQLQPWYYNTKKRLVKRPKIYFRDSGLYHSMLSIVDYKELLNHPKLGASWEGFAIEQVIQYFSFREDEVFFWAVHTGAELDLFFMKNGKSWGVEVKFNEVPAVTKSMKAAIQELSLEHLWIVYPGKDVYGIDKKISAVPINKLNSIRFK